MRVQEVVMLGHALVSIYLDADTYRISYGDAVVYQNGRRCVRGRWAPYRFRSIEQLRYDFERDVEAIGGRLA